MTALLVCLALLQSRPVKDRAESLQLCRQIATQAETRGLNPALPVALAYHESSMTRHAVSRVGALGPLQVMPRYIKCDASQRCLIKTGLDIFEYWGRRYRDPTEIVAHYNGGNRPGKRSYRWARAVVALSKRIGGE